MHDGSHRSATSSQPYYTTLQSALAIPPPAVTIDDAVQKMQEPNH